jgi:hypothetical protein
MNNVADLAGTNVAEIMKKSWSKPEFEVIGREIVQSGAPAAGETTAAVSS